MQSVHHHILRSLSWKIRIDHQLQEADKPYYLHLYKEKRLSALMDCPSTLYQALNASVLDSGIGRVFSTGLM